MKSNSEEIANSIKGLAVAAARVRDQVKGSDKEKLLGDMPRRQRDIVRQQLLEIESDVATIVCTLTPANKG